VQRHYQHGLVNLAQFRLGAPAGVARNIGLEINAEMTMNGDKLVL
jgi:hypothetical protein